MVDTLNMLPGAFGMFGVMGSALWCMNEPRRGPVLWLSIAVLPFFFLFGPIMAIVDHACPLKYDAVLAHVDAAMGLSSFAVARALSANWIFAALGVIYKLLPTVMLLWYAVHLEVNGEPRKLLEAYLVAFGLSPLFYCIVPAVGPGFLFASMPATAELIRASGAPNCVPSCHLAAALIIAAFSPGKLRVWGWLLVLGTAAATVALGEHYVVDLLIAIPYSGFVLSVVRRRWAYAGCCLGLVLIPMAAIRLAYAP